MRNESKVNSQNFKAQNSNLSHAIRILALYLIKFVTKLIFLNKSYFFILEMIFYFFQNSTTYGATKTNHKKFQY